MRFFLSFLCVCVKLSENFYLYIVAIVCGNVSMDANVYVNILFGVAEAFICIKV